MGRRFFFGEPTRGNLEAIILRTIICLCALLACLPVFAQQEAAPLSNKTREGMEWANFWWEHAPDKTLPRVLLIGDSITNQYKGEVQKLLAGKANVDMMATSANILDPQFTAAVKLAIGDYKHAVIHFNNGLHGFHLTDAEYEAGLRALVALFRELEPQAKLIWASNTPVVDPKQVDTLAGGNATVLRRNASADRVMAELGIPINDLYTPSVGHPEYRNPGDGYHYNQQGKTVQAAAVTKVVSEALGL